MSKQSPRGARAGMKRVTKENAEALRMRADGMSIADIAMMQERSLDAVRSFFYRDGSLGPVGGGRRCTGCGRIGARVDACGCGRPRGSYFDDSAMMAIGSSKFEVKDTEDPEWVLVEEDGARATRMRRIDVTPCARCGLRGHVAGDAERCVPDKVEVTGLGGAAWMTGGDADQGNGDAQRIPAKPMPGVPKRRIGVTRYRQLQRSGVPEGRCRCDDCTARRGATPRREDRAQWERLTKENELRWKAKRGDTWRE